MYSGYNPNTTYLGISPAEFTLTYLSVDMAKPALIGINRIHRYKYIAGS